MIVPENLEPFQLLNLFSGIHSDTHSSPYTDYPTHTLPMLFVCEVNRGVVTFTQLQRPVTKKSLKPDKCYLLTYKASVSVVRLESHGFKPRLIQILDHFDFVLHP